MAEATSPSESPEQIARRQKRIDAENKIKRQKALQKAMAVPAIRPSTAAPQPEVEEEVLDDGTAESGDPHDHE